MIRFLRGFENVALEDCPADRTVLDYLREDCARSGTKEGCASGDCGACTVVTARPADGGLRYETVNACIAPLGSLHGCQLIAVEDLADDEVYHPVQQAMIDCHGSQCGFCTPGFVMSLFGLYQRPGEHDRETIIEALGGNLCRCTGYRPILAAAEQALSGARGDRFSEMAGETAARLDAIVKETPVAGLSRGEQRYLRPASAQQVAELYAEHPQARLVAGGTDLLLEVTQSLKSLPQLIDVTAVKELAEVSTGEDEIRYGAAVSHQASLPALLDDYPECAELLERFGSLQIRSRGTVAGNVANASPIGDWPPLLLALDGRLTLMSEAGTRELPVDDFFLDYRRTALKPGEFIHSVHLPRRAPGLFLRAYKISKRYEDDISSVCAVFALQMSGDRVEGVRIGFGGMAATPMRAAACETALAGAVLNEGSIAEAARALGDDFQPISDARASDAYRMQVARNLLRRLQLEYEGDVTTRVHDSHQRSSHG